MRKKFWDRLLPENTKHSWLRNIVFGSMYRISDIRSDSSIADIKTQIDTMRALARDSQIQTALSYYATDATTANSEGKILWASPVDKNDTEVSDVVNQLIEKWRVTEYARDHVLELATIGNLYIPTSALFAETGSSVSTRSIMLDGNSILDDNYRIIPSTKIPPEDIIHLWLHGEPQGFVLSPDDTTGDITILPDDAVIHFSLGGLLGDYTITDMAHDIEYDIQFAQPLMQGAVQPTQTLSLLEDANVLSSLTRVVKFINVECGNAQEDEIRDTLQQIKDAIEQQLSLNTVTGDAQSFVNPQSPNNLIYLPRVNGQDPISVTDLNMSEATEQDSKLLNYYQDKKLSVLGVPKEVLNFSSNEGLGGAGSVLSQRSAIYANALQRLETAYTSGWTDAFNKYFARKKLSGFQNRFILHMNPIVTEMSTVVSERRDSAIGQASQLVDVLKSLGITDSEVYLKSLTELLSECLPNTSADALTWKMNIDEAGGDDLGM